METIKVTNILPSQLFCCHYCSVNYSDERFRFLRHRLLIQKHIVHMPVTDYVTAIYVASVRCYRPGHVCAGQNKLQNSSDVTVSDHGKVVRLS